MWFDSIYEENASFFPKYAFLCRAAGNNYSTFSVRASSSADQFSQASVYHCPPFSGDRVTAVTVSFSQITLEDATAILSQSSPYNVQLHLQKAGGQRKTTPPGTRDRRHHSSSDPAEVSWTLIAYAKDC